MNATTKSSNHLQVSPLLQSIDWLACARIIEPEFVSQVAGDSRASLLLLHNFNLAGGPASELVGEHREPGNLHIQLAVALAA